MGGSGGWGGHGQGHRVGGALARRKLTPEVLAHARHLAAEVQRVRISWVLGVAGRSGAGEGGKETLLMFLIHLLGYRKRW